MLSHARVRLSGTWLYTEDPSDLKARRGKALPTRPEWEGYGRLEGYLRPGGAFGEIGVAVELEVLTGSFLDFANLVEVPERVLLGAAAWAGIWGDELQLRVAAHNLTGDRVQDQVSPPSLVR